MTDARAYLAGIKERADAATAGPWEAEPYRIGFGGNPDREPDFWEIGDNIVYEESDAEFIAHSRIDLPRVADALLAVLDLAEQWQENFPYKAALIRAAITEALEASL